MYFNIYGNTHHAVRDFEDKIKQIFQKVSFKTLSCCNFMQKIRKILRINFSKISHFGPFWPKNPRARFFSKSPTLSFFHLDDTLTSCKKSENSY